jgi:hypothetical protein
MLFISRNVKGWLDIPGHQETYGFGGIMVINWLNFTVTNSKPDKS